jgi:transcriptional regulator with XRE-family HTH domain
MNTAARLVRTARRGRGFSQRALAAASNREQSEIARLERSAQSARIELVERLLRAADQRLAALPTTRTPVAEHADSIADLLAHGDERRAYRNVIQLADDLAAEHGAERVALAVTPPPTTNDDRFDALIAGITELRLEDEDLPLPKWLDKDTHVLSTQWFVDRYATGDEGVIAATPEPLRRRGVVLDPAELISV